MPRCVDYKNFSFIVKNIFLQPALLLSIRYCNQILLPDAKHKINAFTLCLISNKDLNDAIFNKIVYPLGKYLLFSPVVLE